MRSCWPHAGDLVHLDTKKLGRIGAGGGKRFGGPALKHSHEGIGWDYAHVAVDDATRRAYAEELADERAETAVAFLARALAFFESHGIEVRRLLTDNGSCYRSHRFAAAAEQHGLRLWHTRPYRPQTNGKAEAFVDRPERLARAALPHNRATDRRPAGLPRLLQWLPTAWRLGRRHTARQAHRVNNLVMQNS